MNSDAHIQVSRLGSAAQPLKIAVVTETYPPDINGVAHTLSKIVQGLQGLGHDLWLIRPKQQAQHMAVQTAHFQEVLVKGVPIPFYSELRMGLPAKRELQRLWAKQRPDIVHIATEGPLGWSALQVARKLKLPVSTDFRTNYHAYSQHYGIGWLSGAIRVRAPRSRRCQRRGGASPSTVRRPRRGGASPPSAVMSASPPRLRTRAPWLDGRR